MKKPILIIGSGLAGITLARELRKLDKKTEIVILSADDGSFYSKPSMSTALASGKQPEQLLLASADKLSSQLEVNILPHVHVQKIIAGEASVATSAGMFDFGSLVLAVGARQVRLPLTGSGAQDVVSVNSLDDYRDLRRKLVGKRRVAIIGAGLIGCEFANDLRSAGVEVDVFDVASRLLARLLPPKASEFLHARLAGEGIRFHFSTQISAVHKEDDAYWLMDGDGNHLRADIVLSAIGLVPNKELAQSGLIETRRGIVVDRQLRTTANNVYALGDCAEVEGHVLPYVLPLMQAAKALAQTLSGSPTAVAYPAMPVMIKTPACPVVVCPPTNCCTGAWDETAVPDGLRSVYFDRDLNTPAGFALLGSATGERLKLVAGIPDWLQ